MSEPKLMSPEELDAALASGQSGCLEAYLASELIRAHIAALEAQRSNEMQARGALIAKKLALEADNAALLEYTNRVDARRHELFDAAGLAVNVMEYGRHRDNLLDVLGRPGGPALHAGPHPGAALLEEHRKALVRARNEGLEKAKEAVRCALTTGLLAPGNVTQVLREIDAMKEPEE